ncbi:MAG: tRNA preQ1(34) S-adenosylmethionine ribosyltransferase-isomerase QueA [Clostridia bacterium]|nr:tRNA preQ1(34) S-adenosylmethionine ribosyltransferase-isomerase QueA [Clostridia bacterium]
MKLEEFNYNLPEELIAQVPISKRDESRLMVLNRENKTIEHKTFKDIIDYLKPGDCLVRNNTKVIPARLYGKKETGANVEFVLLKQLEGDIWESIVRPGNKLKPGTVVKFGETKYVDSKNKDQKSEDPKLENEYLLKATILDIMEGGTRKVNFEYDGIFNEILDKIGLMPLPPYIHESLKEKDRYQTVYAKYDGSAAAPTAGLHFTPELLKKIEEKGVKIANVTLHVGIGTFRPVKEENIEDHQMHTEHFYIKQEDVDKINDTKKAGGRVIAVGTTSCRVLETIASEETGLVRTTEADTGIYIYPGYKFKCIDGLITNFHLPKSTLLMLVSALAGREFVLDAYNEAVKEKYRFFSFGDAMFIK